MTPKTDTRGRQAAQNWGLCVGFTLGAALVATIGALLVTGYYPTVDWPFAVSTAGRFVGLAVSAGVSTVVLIALKEPITDSLATT